MNKETKQQIVEAAETLGYGVKFNNKTGTFKVCRSYFYHHGLTAELVARKFSAAFTGATLVGSGDHSHAFVGGAKAYSSQDSYVWAEFRVV